MVAIPEDGKLSGSPVTGPSGGSSETTLPGKANDDIVIKTGVTASSTATTYGRGPSNIDRDEGLLARLRRVGEDVPAATVKPAKTSISTKTLPTTPTSSSALGTSTGPGITIVDGKERPSNLAASSVARTEKADEHPNGGPSANASNNNGSIVSAANHDDEHGNDGDAHDHEGHDHAAPANGGVVAPLRDGNHQGNLDDKIEDLEGEITGLNIEHTIKDVITAPARVGANILGFVGGLFGINDVDENLNEALDDIVDIEDTEERLEDAEEEKEDTTVLNFVADRLHMANISAFDDAIEAIDNGANMEVVVASAIDGAYAAYAPDEQKVFVSDSLIADALQQMQAGQAVNHVDAQGNIDNAAAFNATDAGADSFDVAISLDHELTHVAQDQAGIIDKTNAQIESTLTRLDGVFDQLTPEHQETVMAGLGEWIDKEKIHALELPAYHGSQDMGRVNANQDAQIKLTISEDNTDLPVAQAIENIYTMGEESGADLLKSGAAPPANAISVLAAGDEVADAEPLLAALLGSQAASAYVIPSLAASFASAPAEDTVQGVDELEDTLRVPTLRVPTEDVDTLRVPTLRVPTEDVDTLRVPTLRVPTGYVDTLRVPTLRVPTDLIDTLRVPTLRVPTDLIDTLRVPTLRVPTDLIDTLRVPTLRVPTDLIDTLRVPTLRVPTDYVE